MNDFAEAMLLTGVLVTVSVIGFTIGHDAGVKEANTIACETRKVVCEVPDVEIKIP